VLRSIPAINLPGGANEKGVPTLGFHHLLTCLPLFVPYLQIDLSIFVSYSTTTKPQ